jgi:hypothetical protein
MKRWLEWFKTPPSWRVLRVANAVLAVAMIACAVIVDDRWVAIVDAFIAGFNLAGVFHATAMIRVMGSFDKLREAFDQMSEISSALINGHISTVMVEMRHRDNDGGAPPIAPKLH